LLHLLRVRRSRASSLLPYTTLFRSRMGAGERLIARVEKLRRTKPERAWRTLDGAFAGAVRAGDDLTRGELWRLRGPRRQRRRRRSEEHTSELQSLTNLVCRLLLEKK